MQKLVFSAIKSPVDRWHSWLGHPSRDIVRHVVSKNNLPCAHFQGSSSSVCGACACAKDHQLPYSMSSSVSSVPVELIHSDVWGPTIDSFGRKNYYVSFIDDYSNSLGFICFATNLRCLNTLFNFRSLLNDNLGTRSLSFNLIGQGV
jgi:hypothetical protein